VKHLATILASGISFWSACGVAADPKSSAGAIPIPDIQAVAAPGTIFNASPVPLSGSGYYEKEYFVRGNANRYRVTSDKANAELIDSSHPYVTRAIVRAPVDPGRFNGTVIVEWLNVTTGQDFDFVFGATRDLLMREGYAYIGVSAQRGGTDTLRKWNRNRYENVTLAASNVDPRTGTEIDPARGVALGGDVLAWDLFSQVGAAARSDASGLLPGLSVKQLIATGESQSSARLTMYYNSIHPLHRVYDGFLLYDRGLSVRTDLDTKWLAVGTGFMSRLYGPPQPDDANHRWWEIAGASHVSLPEMDYVDASFQRDGVFRDSAGRAMSLTDLVAKGSCAVTPLWSRVPNDAVLKAALSALHAWIETGNEPTIVDRLALDSSGKPAMDEVGREIGGLRTAAYDVPISKTGVNSGGGFCRLANYHIDFTPTELCARYGSQAAYVDLVRRQTQKNVENRLFLPEEAAATIEQASKVKFDCK
jgi:hypothetical protein